MEEYGQDRVKAFLDQDPLATGFVADGDLHAACLVRAARRHGIADAALTAFTDSRDQIWLRLALADKVAYFRRGRLVIGAPGGDLVGCRHVNGSLLSVLDHKQVSKELFRILGFPVPEGRLFDPSEEEAAIAYGHALGGPLCIKANGLGKGVGVFPNLTEESHWRRAFRMVAAQESPIVVERHWGGAAIRHHFVHPRVVGVRMDLPANVDGDGVSTLAQLIAAKNVEKARRTGHAPIAIDDDLMIHLERQGLDLGHVPEPGRRLFLRSVSNGYRGGDGVNCRQMLHPSYVHEIERLCNAMAGLRVTAVDTKVLDPSVPATPDNYVVLEANSSPGMIPFHFPWTGEPQDVAGALVAALLRPDWPWPDAETAT
jgi:D-alanine-D-alanine ligase-like ATP-grasp enzyme